jgi:hypothetical protein
VSCNQFKVLVLLLGVACQSRADRGPLGEPAGDQLASILTECDLDSVRPSTGAPAEGLWVHQSRVTSQRVAAMIGPAKALADQAQVIRRVETLETLPGADTIRLASDTASVRLELIPPGGRPAAVYPVSSLVLLASYEPCGLGMREPLLRYLRRDADGQVATDVLLQRDAGP